MEDEMEAPIVLVCVAAAVPGGVAEREGVTAADSDAMLDVLGALVPVTDEFGDVDGDHVVDTVTAGVVVMLAV